MLRDVVALEAVVIEENRRRRDVGAVEAPGPT